MKGIVNLKQDKSYTLYMGRENKWLGLPQSKWANPFPMKAEWQRPQCLYNFVDYAIHSSALLSCLDELTDQIGGCYCRPKVCHLDVWHYLFWNREKGVSNLRVLHAKCDPETLFLYLTDWRDVCHVE